MIDPYEHKLETETNYSKKSTKRSAWSLFWFIVLYIVVLGVMVLTA